MSTNKPKTRSAPIVKKEVKNNVGPTKPMVVNLTKDTAVGDYLRIFLGTNLGGKTEMILHRPIGVTDLDKDDWVLSEPENIQFLIARSEDPERAKIAQAKNGWLLDKALGANLLVKEEGTDRYVYPGTKETRTEFFTRLKTAWKNDKQNEGKAFNLATALSRSNEPVAPVEIKIRNLFTELGPEAEREFRSVFRTHGGARADRPQESLEWAKSRTLQEITDTILKYGVSGPPIVPAVRGDVGVAPNAPSMGTLVAEPPGQPGQWCFLPDSFNAKKKLEVKAALKAIKEKLETDSGTDKFQFSVKLQK